jgi:hypothetical protein
MTHTQYRDNHALLIPNRALAYAERDDKSGYTLDVSYFEQTGDGAVHTSVEDLLKWDENFYSPRVGGKEFLGEIQERGKLNDGKVLDYAKGLFHGEYRGLKSVSHGGAWGGYRAELLRFPDQHFSVACLCNVGNAGPTRRADQVADIYLGSLMKPRASKPKNNEEKEKGEIAVDADQLPNYSGDYWSEELGVAYRLGIADGRIKVLAVSDGSGAPRDNHFSADVLRAIGTDEFEVGKSRVTLHFQRDAKQRASGFTLDAGRTKGLSFQRK